MPSSMRALTLISFLLPLMVDSFAPALPRTAGIALHATKEEESAFVPIEAEEGTDAEKSAKDEDAMLRRIETMGRGAAKVCVYLWPL